MIVVVAALKGGVGKTTTAVYLRRSAGGGKRSVDPGRQRPSGRARPTGSSTRPTRSSSRSTWSRRPPSVCWCKTLDRVEADDVAVVDTPPGHERLLAKALERADVVVIPTRVGGVETARVEAVLDMVPKRLPAGLVFSSARTFTRDYQETVAMWQEAGVPVWGTIPERVGIAAGPDGWLSAEGLELYGEVMRRARRATRS